MRVSDRICTLLIIAIAGYLLSRILPPLIAIWSH